MNQGSKQTHDSHAAFPTTAWTLIREVQDAVSEDRAPLLRELLLPYWRPLYAYYRSKSQSSQDAQNLVQDFLGSMIAEERLLKFGQKDSKFRSWLMRCALNYLIDQERKGKALKRRPQGGIVSFEDLRKTDGAPFEPEANADPDKAYGDAWRRDVLDRAMDVVEHVCAVKKREIDLQIFLEYYCGDDPQRPAWHEVAGRHALPNWKVAARKADWVKAQFQKAIRHAVRKYVDSEDEVDDEIRELLSL